MAVSSVPTVDRAVQQSMSFLRLLLDDYHPRDFAVRGGGALALRPSQFIAASADMLASRDEMPQLIRRYGDIHIPVDVLMGTEDAILDYRVHAQRLPTQIPHADVTLVAGGHMLPVTQAKLVADWLLAL